MDIDNLASIDACFATLQKEGRIPAVLVNNAAWGVRVPFEDMSDDEMHGMLQTNVLGTMRVTQAWLRARRDNQPGVVIAVSSLAGKIGLLYHSVYCASKWAVEGWAEALQYEVAPRGIRVKLVEPFNRIETAFFEKARAKEADRTVSAWNITQYTAYKEAFEKTASSLKTTDVAAVIFCAATDGKTTMRYRISKGFSLPFFALLHSIWPSCAIRLLTKRYKGLVGRNPTQDIHK